jgi:hypothetical protein
MDGKKIGGDSNLAGFGVLVPEFLADVLLNGNLW